MSADEDLETLPDSPAPESAACVRDLVWLVNDNQKVTFTRVTPPNGDEPPFYDVMTMGGYINNGLPRIDRELTWETRPTPRRGLWGYRPLASLGEVTVRFEGEPEWMSDFYGLGTTLYLVSEKVMDLVSGRDPHAFEATKATMRGRHASAIGAQWVIMPNRVFDAVDIAKSDVEVRRPDRLRGLNKFVTHVTYKKGYVFKDIFPDDVCCFVEEFCGRWYWHRELIDQAARAGVRGLLFGYGQGRGYSHEIRLRGPNDPEDW